MFSTLGNSKHVPKPLSSCPDLYLGDVYSQQNSLLASPYQHVSNVNHFYIIGYHKYIPFVNRIKQMFFANVKDTGIDLVDDILRNFSCAK